MQLKENWTRIWFEQFKFSKWVIIVRGDSHVAEEIGWLAIDLNLLAQASVRLTTIAIAYRGQL